MSNYLDKYLLELILMDTISMAGGRCIPQAERVIQRYIPPTLYDQIIARYDELSEDFNERNTRALFRWYRIAARKEPPWKRQMIVRFVHILSANGPIGLTELADVAALAARINARRECRQVFRALFGRTYPPKQVGRQPMPRRSGYAQMATWLAFVL